jgi:phosphopentomutase
VRALLIVLDSVGVGDAPDAETYGDGGANTLRHIFEQQPSLALPNLCSLGLAEVLPVAGDAVPGRSHANTTSPTGRRQRRRLQRASYGRMRERSAGKDTTTGHWELAGAVLEEPFATFERFPDELVQQIERDAGVEFIGNYASSGTTVLEVLAEEHLRTGKPILYTSADSVLQIAAHEEVIPIERLYAICNVARKHADRARIGRVIARPFLGTVGNFKRTQRRHDYSMQPPRTVLDAISEAGLPVIGVGKISDIFAGSGVTESLPTASNAEGMQRIAELWRERRDGFIFANLVDFDMLFGHRRDVAGYAKALEEFDRWLGNFLPQIESDDLVIITADHGNDPTFRGTDHTREQVPLFALDGSEPRDLGTRETFADVAASLADYFALPPWHAGTSFLNRVAA